MPLSDYSILTAVSDHISATGKIPLPFLFSLFPIEKYPSVQTECQRDRLTSPSSFPWIVSKTLLLK